jgi:hypothetical protein
MSSSNHSPSCSDSQRTINQTKPDLSNKNQSKINKNQRPNVLDFEVTEHDDLCNDQSSGASTSHSIYMANYQIENNNKKLCQNGNEFYKSLESKFIKRSYYYFYLI